MFIPIQSLDARQWSGSAIAVPGGPPLAEPSPREQHARLLVTAAARRMRAAERAGLRRDEDAGYWKACAPVAVAKAAILRALPGFARLP